MVTIKIDWKEYSIRYREWFTIYDYLRKMIARWTIKNTNFKYEPQDLVITKWFTITITTTKWPCWFF